MICEEEAGGQGLCCHSQSSESAYWSESRWAELSWQGAGSGRSYNHCPTSKNLELLHQGKISILESSHF